ncbi:MAG: sugar phosphate isomerase/epimerase [Gemmatimonadota bacterium]
MKRRDALWRLGLGSLSALVHPARVLAAAQPQRLSRIGVQLYTVRQLMAQNVEETLRRVAEVGFTEVEFAGHFERTARSLRTTLDDAGLTSPASHLSLADFAADSASRTLEAAMSLGHRYVVIAWMDAAQRASLDDWKRIAEQFNRIGEMTRSSGLRFAYHNHEYDHVPLEGRVPLDVLLESTDPSLVRVELDLYWITKGGGDWRSYFDRWPGRFPMVHVKDSAGPPDHVMCDVGTGTIPFANIFAQKGRAGIEHFFVEHDTPKDPIASIRSSYDYLRRLTF